MAVEKHEKKLPCSMASLTHCPQRWKAFSHSQSFRIGFDWKMQAAFSKNTGRNRRAEESIEGTEPTESGRGWRLVLRRRKPLTILEDRPEIALKKANAKFSRRFRAMEGWPEKCREFKDLPREEMEHFGRREEVGREARLRK